MKRLGILLLITLSVTITCFSTNILKTTNNDSTVLITSNQLKYTNLIFAEHQKLLEENSLLIRQIDNYKNKIVLMNQTDSLRLSQIDNYQKINQIYKDNNQQLLSKISSKSKLITALSVGSFCLGIGLILLLVK